MWFVFLLWVLGGLIVLMGVFSYVELGIWLFKLGGEYNFFYYIYYLFLGYFVGWVLFMVGFVVLVVLVVMVMG